MNSRPVFVLVTAKGCGACRNFRRMSWNSLHEILTRLGTLNIKDFETPSLLHSPSVDSTGTKAPDDLKRWIKWFPTIALFTGKSWTLASQNPSSQLEGEVFGGEMINGNLESRNGPFPDTLNVPVWIENVLRTSKFNSMEPSPILSLLSLNQQSPHTQVSSPITAPSSQVPSTSESGYLPKTPPGVMTSEGQTKLKTCRYRIYPKED